MSVLLHTRPTLPPFNCPKRQLQEKFCFVMISAEIIQDTTKIYGLCISKISKHVEKHVCIECYERTNMPRDR